MSKVRVYEVAKECNVSSKELVEALQQVGIDVSSHMSTLDEEVAQQIKAILLGTSDKKEKTKDQNLTSESNQAETVDSASIEEDEIQEEWLEEERRVPPAKRKKRNKKGAKKREDQRVSETSSRQVELPESLTVRELAELFNVSVNNLIAKLMQLGVMANINQTLDRDIAAIVGEEYGIQVIAAKPEEHSGEEDRYPEEEQDDPKDLRPRPPIVTVLGHVDHGKTSLLDRIRKTNVTQQEAGGITQHIGAYQAKLKNKKITFLDTPGHAAFTAMRARGAQVTDVAVLVVAADDGVMPQTVEAINHAKAAEVPIVVAVNKIDKPNAKPEAVRQQLTEHGLIPEEWGGDTIFVNVSALTGEGIDDLLESILLLAELQELKANPKRNAQGVIIEAQIEKGRGRVATVIVQNGTLRVGDHIVAGMYYGKIKAMLNDKGRRVKEAVPSTPVVILGLDGLPEPGDKFKVYEDEKEAKAVAAARQEKARQEELNARARMSLDDLFARMKEGETQELNVIVKADVQGSVEAIRGALAGIDIPEVEIKIIHSGVGAVNENDVMLAATSDAIIIGFNVRAESNARQMAESQNVEVRYYRVIYNLLEDIEAAAKGLLAPEYREVVIGQAEVRQTFKVPRVGTIAGCYVTEGVIQRNAAARVLREGTVVYEGRIDSLKRFKEDVREVSHGYECGIGLENFNDIKEGDIIEACVMQEIPR